MKYSFTVHQQPRQSYDPEKSLEVSKLDKEKNRTRQTNDPNRTSDRVPNRNKNSDLDGHASPTYAIDEAIAMTASKPVPGFPKR